MPILVMGFVIFRGTQLPRRRDCLANRSRLIAAVALAGRPEPRPNLLLVPRWGALGSAVATNARPGDRDGRLALCGRRAFTFDFSLRRLAVYRPAPP